MDPFLYWYFVLQWCVNSWPKDTNRNVSSHYRLLICLFHIGFVAVEGAWSDFLETQWRSWWRAVRVLLVNLPILHATSFGLEDADDNGKGHCCVMSWSRTVCNFGYVFVCMETDWRYRMKVKVEIFAHNS